MYGGLLLSHQWITNRESIKSCHPYNNISVTFRLSALHNTEQNVGWFAFGRPTSKQFLSGDLLTSLSAKVSCFIALNSLFQEISSVLHYRFLSKLIYMALATLLLSQSSEKDIEKYSLQRKLVLLLLRFYRRALFEKLSSLPDLCYEISNKKNGFYYFNFCRTD